MEDYSKAIELNLQHDKAYYNTGTAFITNEEYDMTILTLSKTIDFKHIISTYQ